MPTEDADGLRRILGDDRVAVVGASTSYEGRTRRAGVPPATRIRTPTGQPDRRRSLRRTSVRLTGQPEPVDIVEVFRPSEEVPGIVEQALARDDVRAIRMQQGIRHNEAARTAEAADVDVVRDRCTKVERGQLIRNPME